MPNDWMDRWEDRQEAARQARSERAYERARLRAMSDPQWALDGPDDDEPRKVTRVPNEDDWYWRKYGPDPADVAFEKQRAIAEDAEPDEGPELDDEDDWEDGEDADPGDLDPDSAFEEDRLARYDDDPNPYAGTLSED